ncbi:MAG TPA: thiol-disulfide oxidoreductase DCC family protein [Vicinamibacterales bacterium]|nr:thiol-disulfide oxidoreductase DCC family protein [Vicinamibacterales bacterium]
MATSQQFPSIVLFDGVCNLCNGAVAFIIARDHRAQFGFASLQSDAGRRLLRELNGGDALPDTFVLVEEGRMFTQSTAALRIAQRLGFPWSLAALLTVLPRAIRDRAYRVVARNRYRWFGKRETCMMPTPDLRRRFLE